MSSQGPYQRTTLIQSKKPTIHCQWEMNLSWVAAKPGKLGLFKAPTPFYSMWNDARNMKILEQGCSWIIFANTRVSQIRPVGLSILENDSSGWVSKHGGRGFFHASSDFTSWTIHMLMDHGDVQRSVGIYDVVWAFKDRLELPNMEVMRAIIECFWLVINTFVTRTENSNSISRR